MRPTTDQLHDAHIRDLDQLYRTDAQVPSSPEFSVLIAHLVESGVNAPDRVYRDPLTWETRACWYSSSDVAVPDVTRQMQDGEWMAVAATGDDGRHMFLLTQVQDSKLAVVARQRCDLSTVVDRVSAFLKSKARCDLPCDPGTNLTAS